jgi:hypothetical protein
VKHEKQGYFQNYPPPPPRNLLTKSKAFLLTIFIILFAFAMIACEEEDAKDELDGTTWKHSYTGTTEDGTSYTTTYVLTFSSPNFTLTATTPGYPSSTMGTGTYSVSGSTVNLTPNEGDPTTGTLSGNTLTMSGLTFTKQ